MKSWKALLAIPLLAILTACGGQSDHEDKQEEEKMGEKFDKALEEAKRKLEDSLDSFEAE